MTAPTTAECEELAEWLRREMPAGTVIGNPDWWAKRIAARANAALLAVAAERDANYDLLTKAGLDAQCAINERDHWKSVADERDSEIESLKYEVNSANRLLKAATTKMDKALAEVGSLRGLLQEALDAEQSLGVNADLCERMAGVLGVCLARTMTGGVLPRCENYPRCPCGGPDGWPDAKAEGRDAT